MHDAFRPQWKMWVAFGIDRDIALEIDGLHSTRPIEYEVVSPDDTRGMFDVLTYEKGGCGAAHARAVPRRRDLPRRHPPLPAQAQLRQHRARPTSGTRSRRSPASPCATMMNTWILQGGHPLVTLENGALTQLPFAYGPTTRRQRHRLLVDGARA